MADVYEQAEELAEAVTESEPFQKILDSSLSREVSIEALEGVITTAQGWVTAIKADAEREANGG